MYRQPATVEHRHLSEQEATAKAKIALPKHERSTQNGQSERQADDMKLRQEMKTMLERIASLEVENRALRQVADPSWKIRLTPKQRRILLTIDTHNVEYGCSPTMREIASKWGLSQTTVHEYCRVLVTKGAITKDRNRSRGIRITAGGKNYLRDTDNQSGKHGVDSGLVVG